MNKSAFIKVIIIIILILNYFFIIKPNLIITHVPKNKTGSFYSNNKVIELSDGRVFFFPKTNHRDHNCNIKVYDSNNNIMLPELKLNICRKYHSITKLKDDRILVYGGESSKPDSTGKPISTYTNTAEVYDPKANRFNAISNIIYPRTKPSSILLKDGKVLIVGGEIESDQGKTIYLKVAEVFDPSKNRFNKIEDNKYFSYLFDLETKKYKKLKQQIKSRFQKSSIELADDNVLFAGGGYVTFLERHFWVHLNFMTSARADFRSTPSNAIMIFDKNKAKFKKVGLMRKPCYAPKLNILSSGKVLILNDSLEIYDPKKKLSIKELISAYLE